MLIQLLSEIIYKVIDTLIPLEIPMFGAEVDAYIVQTFSYMGAGAGILANYVPLDYFMSLLGIIISVEIVVGIYRFVMWVAKKVPLLGIED